MYFNDALAAAGSPDPSRVYFVDDSALNIKGAHGLRWGHCVLFDEHGDQRERLGGLDKLVTDGAGKVSVIEDMQGEWANHFFGHQDLFSGEAVDGADFEPVVFLGLALFSSTELRQVWPEMFVSRVQNGHGAETGTNGRTHD